jgi:hypothetical protein
VEISVGAGRCYNTYFEIAVLTRDQMPVIVMLRKDFLNGMMFYFPFFGTGLCVF